MNLFQRLCQRCARRRKGPRAALWRCRQCNRQVCEHYCGFKSDGNMATCVTCQLARRTALGIRRRA